MVALADLLGETRLPTLHLDRRTVAALPDVSAPTVFYDDRLKGFALRVMPSGTKTWLIEYRPGHGGRSVNKQKLTLGRDSDAFRADAAREMARKELAKVALGSDPAAERKSVRQAETVSQILAAYMDEKIRPKRKPKTAVLFDGYIRNHIAPRLGSRSCVSVTRADLVKLHTAVASKHPTTANRVLSLLAAAYAYGIKGGLLPDGFQNPAVGIDRYRENSRERYLTAEELARLGATLRLAETQGIPWEPRPGGKLKHAPRPENRRVVIDGSAVAALRLLLFTGCRLREILHLKWSYVDLERGLLFLPDSKTGRKTVVLGSPAIAILRSLPRQGEYVIKGLPGQSEDEGERPRADLNRPWARITRHAGLSGLRIHDLRHSFASIGVGSGLGLPIIGRLLGHADTATTARYAHLDADPLKRASDAIAATIEAALTRSSTAAELIG